MERDARAFLWDVQQAATAVDQFIADLDAAGYEENALVRAAVERQFEIIGEALNQLSKFAPDIARRVSDLRQIVGFRNILIHAMRPSIMAASGTSRKPRSRGCAGRFLRCWQSWAGPIHECRTSAQAV